MLDEIKYKKCKKLIKNSRAHKEVKELCRDALSFWKRTRFEPCRYLFIDENKGLCCLFSGAVAKNSGPVGEHVIRGKAISLSCYFISKYGVDHNVFDRGLPYKNLPNERLVARISNVLFGLE